MAHKKKWFSDFPFNVGTQRLCHVGFHPELDKANSMKKPQPDLGPGTYEIKFHECEYTKSKRTNWDRKREMEEYSKFLGFRNAPLIEYRKFRVSLCGPGHSDINDEVFKQQRSSILENVSFGTARRFPKEQTKNLVPPPGTYLKDMNKKLPHWPESFNTTPPLEWDGFMDRLKNKDPKYLLAPNRYSVPDHGSMQAKGEKVVSKRGPYDLFTGPRDQSTIKNHFGPKTFKTPDRFHIQPSSIEHLLKHPTKRRCGKFLQAERFLKKPTTRNMLTDTTLCYRDPTFPGPATYNIPMGMKETPPSMYPFNNSKKENRPGIQWKIHPGPGRYNPKRPRCSKVHHANWVFKTTYDRSIFIFKEPYRAY